MGKQKGQVSASTVPGHDFAGFPAEGLDFLAELGSQDKPWFDANRQTYDQHLVAPTKLFVAALGHGIAESFAPAIVAQPKTNGSIPPINNDLRFSPSTNPYKDHLLLKFWEGADKQTAPKLFVRVARDEIGFSAGARISPAETFRRRVDDRDTGSQLRQILDDLAAKYPIDVGDEKLKRVPRPYSPDHPRADLLRHKGIFHVRWSEPAPPAIHQAGFVEHCLARLRDCADLHRWLVTNL